ncbi:MAG: hypothetical protein J6B75_08250 [Ruminococcus sp.]|nr:hypothetical protein [Ruminococcus sp.]
MPDNWKKSSDTPEAWKNKSSANSDPWANTRQAPTSAENKGKANQAASEVLNAIGGLAKKAKEYAGSEEAANKINAVKSKARSAAEGAGSAISELKNKAADAVSKKKDSSDTTLHEANPTDELKEVSDSDIADFETEYSESNYDMTETEAPPPMPAPPPRTYPKQNRFDRINPAPQPVQNSPQPAYIVQEKKSPVIPILVIVLLIIILAFGILLGLFLSQKKEVHNSKDNNSFFSESEVSTKNAEITTENGEQTTFSAPTTTSVSAKPTVRHYSSDEISSYPQYIKAIEDSVSYYDNKPQYKIWDIYDTGYALCDINNDEIPELIISAGTLDIYSINNGEAVNLTPFYGGNMNSGTLVYETGYISLAGGSGNVSGITFFTYNGGSELDNIDSLSDDHSSGSRVITHNDVEITEEEYNNIIDSYGKQIEFDFTPVTDIISVKSAAPLPHITASITEEPALQGVTVYLNVSGEYSYYTYKCYEYGYGDNEPYETSGNSSEGKIVLTGFSGGVTQVKATVTPYNSDDVAGETVSVSYIPEFSTLYQITPCEKFGTIYSPNGNNVDGLAKSYLIDGGAESYIRHDLTDGWHIKAVNEYYDGTSYWYELYDADDGDYYGWVDSEHIDFY